MKRKTPLLFLLLLALTSCSRPSKSMPPDPSVAETTAETAAQFPPTPDPSVEYPVILTPSLTDQIDHAIYSEGIFLIYNGEHYGFMKEDGQEITPYEYDFADPFSQGLACVSQDGKYGFIDSNGETALPFIYDKAGSFSEGFAYFETNGQYGFMDQKGKIQFLLDCDSVSSFKEGMAYFSIDGKYGYIDKTGAQAIPPMFDDAGYFHHGIAVIRKGVSFGIIDIHGQEAVPAQYDKIESNGPYILVQSDGKYGCLNQKGQTIFPARYDSIITNPDNSTLLLFDGDSYSLADENGIFLSGLAYDSVTAVPEKQLLITTLDGRSGIIGYDGSVKVSAEYDSIFYSHPDSSDMITVSLGEKYGFLDSSDCSLCIPLIYDGVSSVLNNRAVVMSDGKCGIVDRKGNQILPIEYDYIDLNSNGTMAVCKEEDSGFQLLGFDGTLLNESAYDFITAYENCYKVDKGNHYGYLDLAGKEVIPPVYSYPMYLVYNSSDCVVSSKDSAGIRDCLMLMNQPQDTDLSDILLENEITPRHKAFSQFSKYTDPDQFDFSDTPGSFRFTFRLYDINHEGKPILYFYAAPCIQQNFTLSHSGFYAANDDELIELITGYECGGSLRGDFVHLWYDREEDSIKLGTTGVFGGFLGHSRVDRIYDYKDKTVTEAFSFSFVTQSLGNYDGWKLTEHPDLFYDDNDQPYTKDTLLKADHATEYNVNGEQTTIQEYQQCRSRFLEL